jgi:hypothetical protein
LPHFTPVIIHPVAREIQSRNWDAAAEAHAAPERTSPTPQGIPNTMMRARRRGGYVAAETLVAVEFVKLVAHHCPAGFLHTNDTAAGHNQTGTNAAGQLAIRTGRAEHLIVRDRTNRAVPQNL